MKPTARPALAIHLLLLCIVNSAAAYVVTGLDGYVVGQPYSDNGVGDLDADGHAELIVRWGDQYASPHSLDKI